ncbi:outer membrane lipoprotein-sorting protein [Kangiella marina]|uniref:Outer membrane lipoprotein-sorting protein n=2 Tax=Kangiella marina TaxID=1079178 RepID=A0ABP8IJT8_9GAMM
MITKVIISITMTAALLVGNHCDAKDKVSVDDLVSNVNRASYYAGDDGRSDARMIVIDKDGNKQLRQFVILRKDREDEGDQSFLVVFSRPTDVKDTVFLVDKKVKSDDDRWLYLPGLDLVKRISAGDKRTSFVGTDYYYEDVSGRNPALDSHHIINQTEDTYLLKSVPKESGEVEFSYYQSTISKETFLPMTVEYFNDDNKLYRKVEVVEVKEIEGIPTVIKSQVKNLETGSTTLLQFRKPRYNLGIPDDVFTTRSLRSPPRQWLEAK